jgi:hypothetical protein
MSFIKANRRTFAMSRDLKMATVAIMLAFAVAGAANTRGNFDRNPHPFAQAETQVPHYTTRYCGGPKSPMWPSFENNDRIND